MLVELEVYGVLEQLWKIGKLKNPELIVQDSTLNKEPVAKAILPAKIGDAEGCAKSK